MGWETGRAPEGSWKGCAVEAEGVEVLGPALLGWVVVAGLLLLGWVVGMLLLLLSLDCEEGGEEDEEEEGGEEGFCCCCIGCINEAASWHKTTIAILLP